MYPKELENFKRLNAEIFHTFARRMRVQTSRDDGVLVKGCTELLGSPSSQGLLFHSSLHLRHLFSPPRSLSGPEVGAEPLLCLSPGLRTARVPSSLHLHTLIISHHLPDLSLTSLLSTQQAHQHFPLTLRWHLGSQACHSCHPSPSSTFVLFGHVLCSVIPLS